MINNDDCIVLVKDSIECMTRKNVIAQISVDDINSIDRLLSGIYGRNIAEDGSVYFPDEINPKKLADFLWNPCKYSCTKEIMYAYICRFAQRRINELYRDIRQKEVVCLLQLTGIDVSTYSYNRIENGTQNPTVSLLYECCRILGCDMNKLFIISADN